MSHLPLTTSLLFTSIITALTHSALAQSDDRLANLSVITDAHLTNPPAEDWLIWRGTYDAHGFSPLQQIDRSNVDQLRETWRAELQQGPNMATPLVHDGVMFLASTQDTVLALDATTGEELWTYEHRPTAFPSSKMGIALHGDKLIVPTQNMHVIALEARTGELIWDHEIETTLAGAVPYSLRGAPLPASYDPELDLAYYGTAPTYETAPLLHSLNA